MSLLVLKTQGGNSQIVETVDISAVGITTPTKGTNNSQIANTRFIAENTKLQLDLAYLGMDFKSLPTGMSLGFAGSHETLVSQRIRFSTFIVYDTITVTGVKFALNTAGVYTGNNVNGICLYSCSAGTYTKIAATELIDANMWTVANLNTKPFSSPVVLTAGEYKLGFVYSQSAQTTAPIIGTFCAVLNYMTQILSNTDTLQQRVETQTSFGSSYASTALSAVSSIPMIWLY
jgi:hypothetical protein